MEKIRILCFGDSNTWGQVSDIGGDRYNEDQRYPNILQKKLGDDFKVIDEGQCARTLMASDVKPPKGDRCGLTFFAPLICSHDPLDYVVIMLGSNDMKVAFNLKVKDVAEVLEEKYINFLNNTLAPHLHKHPKIIIVAPPLIYSERWIGENIFEGANEKSYAFNETYRQVAQRTGCLFVDNTDVLPGKDGLHLAVESHAILADKIYKVILNDFDKK